MEPMDTKQRIKDQVTGNPVVLYMKGTPQAPQCGFSALAVQVLNACGVSEFAAVNVLADAEIRDASEVALQDEIDQELGFGTRDEHRGIDGERQAVELLAAQDVGHRLAAAAAFDETGEACLGLRGQSAFGKGEHGGLAEAGRCR